MNSFFVLNSSSQIPPGEQYAGYIIFYKKSQDEIVASVQADLYLKLIENGLKLKQENFLIIDITAQKERFSMLKRAMQIQKCLLFGVNEKEVGINFNIPLYQLTIVGDTEFIKADAPEILEREKHLKNQLWKQLQISFKLI